VSPIRTPSARFAPALGGAATSKSLSSDDLRFGGSEYVTTTIIETDPIAAHGRQNSIKLQLPPLGCLILAPMK
jgi:1,4-alpha-glucan branching enzyme